MIYPIITLLIELTDKKKKKHKKAQTLDTRLDVMYFM